MKVKLLMIFFILLCLRAFSQGKFIEVTVSDTAWVIPDNFVYRITVNPDSDTRNDTLQYSNPAAYKQKIKEGQIRHKRMSDSVVQLVKKNGFHILPPTLGEVFQYVGEDEYKVYSFDVLTGSKDSLKMLYDLISKNTTLLATVEAVFAKNEMPYFHNLYKKLLLQAGKKAATLAELSGRKPGPVISITQNNEERDKRPGDWTIYPPLSSFSNDIVPGWHTSIKSKNDFMISNDEIVTAYIIHDTLVVRFVLE